ncbi:hypothetical protein EJ08DRAFT_694226 [Tothia fuscella]|uniref:Uncharacterized protein n=1 Tax=Tothia fuscella TaxID=1048955 RepID=A0A9P4U0M7_9PEZI|nr:hypothetical protein EJ08DRAFT_694226 [Tothia fuscella]
MMAANAIGERTCAPQGPAMPAPGEIDTQDTLHTTTRKVLLPPNYSSGVPPAGPTISYANSSLNSDRLPKSASSKIWKVWQAKDYEPFPMLWEERRDCRRVPRKPFNFLGLPAEVRNQVYELVLPVDEIVALEVIEVENSRGCTPQSWRDYAQEVVPRLKLLRVSKQVKDETSSYFYGSNEFRFLGPNSWMMLVAITTTIGQANVELLNNITIELPFCDGGCAHTLGSREQLKKFLKDCLRLDIPMDSRQFTPDQAFKMGAWALQVAKPKCLNLVLHVPLWFDHTNTGNYRGVPEHMVRGTVTPPATARVPTVASMISGAPWYEDATRQGRQFPHLLKPQHYTGCFNALHGLVPEMKLRLVRVHGRSPHRDDEPVEVTTFVEAWRRRGGEIVNVKDTRGGDWSIEGGDGIGESD